MPMGERCRAIADAHQEMCPLSETQRGVWTYSRQHPQEPFYHIVLRLFCSSETDAGRLADAVRQVVNLHPVLKVTIGMDEAGEPVMLRHDKDMPRVEVVRIPEAERPATEQIFMRPLNVENGELYRFLVVQTEQRTYLYASFHHIIFDGLSSGIFMGEVSAIYEGKPIETETMDAFEVVARERKRRQSSDFETARHWHESAFKPQDIRILPLPDVHGLPQQKTAFKTFPLSVTSAQIEQLAKTSRHTPNIVALSAFALLQGCFTGEEQARFTTLYHGRHGRQMQKTVGMLVQTLPVALQWQAETPLNTLMLMIRRQLQRSMVSDVHSFAEVVQACGGFGDISFVYQGNTIRLPSFCGSPIVQPMLMPSLTGTKLGMELWTEGDNLEMRVEYDANSYSEELVASMVNTYETLLSSMASATTVGDVCYVSDEVLERLDAFNQDSTPFDSTITVVDLFRVMARRYPEAKAVAAEDQVLTYRQLEELTDRWAYRLQEKGVGAGSVVGIQVPRNSWMVTAPLAVLKTGAAYLPILLEQPKTVTDKTLEDAGADGLFTSDGFHQLKISSSSQPPGLLAIFYTSGSTGKPKAVRLTHQNLLAYCDWYQRYFHPKKGLVIGAYNQFAFDGSLTDIFPALLSGATVCIVPEGVRKDIRLLEGFVNRHHVEILDLPTQVGRLFAAQAVCPSLRHIVLGGEAMTPVKLRGSYQLHNQYGPTETTVAATVYPMKGNEAMVPIGKPLSHVKCYVVGTNGRRLPVGAFGELWIAGPQVTFGLGSDNPFEQGGFQRIYRTGDFVRYLPDGNLEYIGRRDGMVKIRGFRVELQEVENVVSQLKGICQAVAVACRHPVEEQSLVVYVTAQTTLDTQQLKYELHEILPSYKIPSAIIQVERLPLTPQGKIDRKALPLPVWGEHREYVAPEGSQETLVCKIFADVLGLHEVSADADFFQLGGTSIMAMHVVTRLERAGYRIGYSALFSNPTPQLLAMKLDETEKGKEKPDELLPSKRLEENVSVAYETNWVRHPLGDVLLTGVTGFLGSHVLKELLLRNSGRIYCLVRRSEKQTGWERLQEVMRFYFDTALDAHLRRIQVIEGDFLTASLPPTKTPLTVINCAALVKHFAAVEDLQKNNVEGPLRLADYCMKKGHRLVQISTLPIGVANAYVRSKMDAEERLLALTTKGLSLKIVRLGNLSPRFSDGALQQQYEKNVTMALLRTVALVGCYPLEAQNVMLDFTPVDEAAKALLLLAETPGNCDVYHLFNPQLLSMGELSAMLKFAGVIAEPVPQAIFEERISRLMQQSAMATKLTAALAWYKELPMPDITFRNHPDNQKTEALLSRCRYHWPVLTASYFQRFLPKM